MRCSGVFKALAFSLSLSLNPREKIQNICLHGSHIAYYNYMSKRVLYGRLRRNDTDVDLVDVFSRPTPHVSCLDMICKDDHTALVAMARYHHRENKHRVELAEIDSRTFVVRAYPFPCVETFPMPVRSCTFVHLEQGLALVCWSIDGIRTTHLLGSSEWVSERFPFRVHHVTFSENTLGVLDQNNVFHLFHPDGTYRNKTIETVSPRTTITACYFSLSSRKLAVCFSDGTLRIYGAHRVPYTRRFHGTIRCVYADTKRFLLFFEDGNGLVGDMDVSLSILENWYNVCDPGCMERVAVKIPYVVLDADREGLVLRRCLVKPSRWIRPSDDDEEEDAFLTQ